MSTSSSPDLGSVITSARARRWIYGVYVVAAFIVGGLAVYILATGHDLPEAVVGAQAVLAYAGIPVGALAAANTRNPAS